MIRHLSSHRSRLVYASALGFLTLAGNAALAQTAPAFDLAAPSATAPLAAATATAIASTTPGLAPLLASPLALRFAGETAHRTYPVFVTGEQSTQASTLSLGYTTAVSVAPEGSSLLVLVNGVELVSQPLKVGSAQSLDVAVPPGLLRAGFNAVNVSVQQFHRVDCSIPGTYELWTALDPASTGFRFGRKPAQIAALSDLPALPRDADGKVRITGLVPSGSSSERVNSTLAAIEAAVVIGAIEDPLVQMNEGNGTDAGLQIAVGTDDELGNLARLPSTQTPWAGVSLVPAQTGGPTMLIVSGGTAADVDRALADLKLGARNWTHDGSQTGLQALADRHGRAVSAGSSVNLADLGADDRPFSGRLFHEAFDLSLPADFYAADYDAATLVLSGAYAANLASDATLFVRANDQVVATLPLSSPRPGLIQDKRLKVPLDKLKPGSNTISVEAMVPNAEDAACEVTANGERPARFMLSASTRLEIPALARVGSYPNLSATFAGVGSAGAIKRDLMVYVPGGDLAARDAAATLVARMTAGSGSIRQPRFVSALPHAESGDLLAVGTYSALPTDLMAALRLSSGSSAFAMDEAATGWNGVTQAQASTGQGDVIGGGAPAKSDTAFSTFAEPVGVERRIAEITRPVADAVRNAIAGYGSSGGTVVKEMPDDGALLVQAPAPAAGAAWTLLAAPTTAMLTEGMHRLGTPETWKAVAGARTEIPAAADQAVVTVGENGERLFETQPRSLSNARLVLAGWFSRHSERYAALVLASSLLLAVSTYLLLRRLGEKGR